MLMDSSRQEATSINGGKSVTSLLNIGEQLDDHMVQAIIQCLKQKLRKFSHQVAGHDDLLRLSLPSQLFNQLTHFQDGPMHLLLKPTVIKEIQFYANAKSCKDIAPVLPKFYGWMHVDALIDHGLNLTLRDKCTHFILIEDLLADMNAEQCRIADIKIGRQMYASCDDSVDDSKRQRMIVKNSTTTSVNLGLRITGLRYEQSSGKLFTKQDGKMLKNFQDFQDVMQDFTTIGRDLNVDRQVRERLAVDLTTMARNLPQEVQLHSSSVLIIIDTVTFNAKIKLIDFAHSFITQDPDYLASSNVHQEIQTCLLTLRKSFGVDDDD
ncbi:hypothetical protein MP228_011865 [Amoeboaphelidium protococcarum]|nr:hypothetical protein MP228_011865 [Amoeboaphelidium protococcarum]